MRPLEELVPVFNVDDAEYSRCSTSFITPQRHKAQESEETCAASLLSPQTLQSKMSQIETKNAAQRRRCHRGNGLHRNRARIRKLRLSHPIQMFLLHFDIVNDLVDSFNFLTDEHVPSVQDARDTRRIQDRHHAWLNHFAVGFLANFTKGNVAGVTHVLSRSVAARSRARSHALSPSSLSLSLALT